MREGLQSLLHPFPLQKFLENYFPDRPFHYEKARGPIKHLLENTKLNDLEVFLKRWPGTVLAALPDYDDQCSKLDIAPEDALRVYRNGMSLIFGSAENALPELRAWIKGIRRDLALFRMTRARCIYYASPKGHGTGPHYDTNVNFVLQLKGRKRWRFAPNRHVSNPVHRHTMGTPVGDSLARYSNTPFPRKMPKVREEVVLERGSIFFVPRGMWHSTVAEEDSLSLNFTFDSVTWIDVLLCALTHHLLQEEEWRALAQGWSSGSLSGKGKSERHFSLLLSHLLCELREISPKTLIEGADLHASPDAGMARPTY
jgi:50S ribosomal protein L16 3-hydroxylase